MPYESISSMTCYQVTPAQQKLIGDLKTEGSCCIPSKYCSEEGKVNVPGGPTTKTATPDQNWVNGYSCCMPTGWCNGNYPSFTMASNKYPYANWKTYSGYCPTKST